MPGRPKKRQPVSAELHPLILDNLALVTTLVNAHERRMPVLRRFDWDDRFQQAILRCLHGLPDFDPTISSIGTRLGWAVFGAMTDMLRVAHNQNDLGAVASLDAFKYQNGDRITVKEMADSAPGPAAHAEVEDNAAHARRTIEQGLSSLPWKLTWAVRLVRLHGMGLKEAGKMMGVCKERVRQRVAWGMHYLRKWAREEAA